MKELFQTIYFFGTNEEIKKFKNYLENLKAEDLKTDHTEMFYSFLDKNDIKYSFFKKKEEYVSFCRIDNLEKVEDYNILLKKFFHKYIRNYVIENGISSELTDIKENLLYTNPENGIIDK